MSQILRTERRHLFRTAVIVSVELDIISDFTALLRSGTVFGCISRSLFLNYAPQKIIARFSSPVMLVATKILLYIPQGTASTGLAPQTRHQESELQYCWCEVWRHVAEDFP